MLCQGWVRGGECSEYADFTACSAVAEGACLLVLSPFQQRIEVIVHLQVLVEIVLMSWIQIRFVDLREWEWEGDFPGAANSRFAFPSFRAGQIVSK